MKFPIRLKKRRSVVALVSSALLIGLLPAAAMAQTDPTISGYALGSNNATLTIRGSGFGSTAATVTLDNATATIVTWSDSQIVIVLPSTDGPGTLDITTSSGLQTSEPFNGVERGYYTLSSSGAVTATGGLQTYGDLTTLGQTITSPAIQLIPTPDYQGYWILTQNGTVYGFGDATNFGSVGASITAVGMAVTPTGNGAFVLSSTGQVYTLGQAVNYGSAPAGTQATAIAATANGYGYWILGSDGTVYPFGDAANLGPASVAQASGTTYANGSLVQVGGSGPIFLVKNQKLYHIPNTTMLAGMGYTMAQVKSVPNLEGYSLGYPMVVPYPDGTVLDPKGSPTVYLEEAGVLHPVTTATVFKALGLKAQNVVIIPHLKPNWPIGPTITQASQPYQPSATPIRPTGTLVRTSRGGTIYLVAGGRLHPFASAHDFLAAGYHWNEIQQVSALPHLPVGTRITSASTIKGPEMLNNTLWRIPKSRVVYLWQNNVLRPMTGPMYPKLGLKLSMVHPFASTNGFAIGPALGSTTVPQGTVPSTTAVGLVPTADNLGYWVLLADGQVDTIGDATPLGSPTPSQMGQSFAVGLAVTPDQGGYSILTSTGTVYSFGDAMSPSGTASGAVSLAMSAAPSASGTTTPTTSSGFFSMAYGSFMPHYDGSYSSMVANAKGLSAIIPTWFYDTQNPSSLAWNIGTPLPGSSTQAVVTEAHSLGIQVWPMIGAVSVGPFQNSANIQSTVSQIVAAVKQYHYDGITIDFEPSAFNGLSLSQASQQYTNFVAALGPALHQVGAKLMVDTYSAFYPGTVFNIAAIAPYVDYINIMSYGHYDNYTEAGPDASLPWMLSVYQTAIQDGVNPQQIIMGFGPYGDYWSYNNSGLDKSAPLGNDSYVSDAQVSQLLQSNPNIQPVWDPVYQSEIFMTNEYVNNNGQWTVNSNGSAVAPNHVFTPASASTFKPEVQNLQGLLNYILVRYADENNQPAPDWLAQDGLYGPATQAAVAQFQQDFHVTGDTTGNYGPNTQAALTQVIKQWNMGEYQYWLDNTQSMQNRVQQVAVANHLAGMSIWRAPFETPDFWTTLESTVTVAKPGSGQ